MKILRWLDKHFEEFIMFIFLWIIVAVAFLQVIMRYALRSSLAWPEELNRYLFIWFSYMALSYSVRYNGPTRIDILETLIPKLKVPLSLICDAGFIAFCIYMLKPGLGVVSQLVQSNQVSPAMGVPMYLVYLGFYVGLILTLIRFVQKYILLFVKFTSEHKKEK